MDAKNRPSIRSSEHKHNLSVQGEKLGCLDPSINLSIKGYINAQMLGLNGSIKKMLGCSDYDEI